MQTNALLKKEISKKSLEVEKRIKVKENIEIIINIRIVHLKEIILEVNRKVDQINLLTKKDSHLTGQKTQIY